MNMNMNETTLDSVFCSLCGVRARVLVVGYLFYVTGKAVG